MKYRPLHFTYLCLVLFAWLAGVHPVSAAIYVSGQVFNAGTKTPLAGVIVSLARNADSDPLAMQATLGNGAFALAVPSPGKYELRADGGPAFADYRKEIDLPAGGLTSLPVDVNPVPHVHLRILGPDGTAASGRAAQVWMVVSKPGEDALGNAAAWRTAADGTVDVPILRGAPLDDATLVGIAVRVRGLGFGRPAAALSPGARVEVHLQPGAVLTGSVSDEFGKPAPDARVQIRGACPDLAVRFLQGGEFTTTDAGGQFTVPDLSPGRYQVDAACPDGETRFRLVDVAGPATEASIADADPAGPVFGFSRPLGDREQATSLRPWIPLRGAQLNPDLQPHLLPITGKALDQTNRQPLPGAILVLSDRQRSITYDAALVGQDGSYRLEAPSPGDYKLSTYGQEYRPFQQEVYTPVGGVRGSDVWLTPAVIPKIKLKLLLPDGSPAGTGKITASIMYYWGANGSGWGGPWNVGPDGTVEVPYLSLSQPPENADRVEIKIEDPRYGWALVDLQHLPKDAVQVKLQQAAVIQGIVVDTAGRAVTGRQFDVRAIHVTRGDNGDWAPDYKIQAQAYSDKQGQFQLPPLPLGDYRLEANSNGLRVDPEPVTLGEKGLFLKLGPAVEPP